MGVVPASAAFRLAHHLRVTNPTCADVQLRTLQTQLLSDQPPTADVRRRLAVVYLALFGRDRLADLVARLLDLPHVGETLLPDLVRAMCPHECCRHPDQRWLGDVLGAARQQTSADVLLRARATAAYDRTPALRPTLLCLAARWAVLPLTRLLDPAASIADRPAVPHAVLRLLSAGGGGDHHTTRVAFETLIRVARSRWSPGHRVLWLAAYYRAFGELPWDWRLDFLVVLRQTPPHRAASADDATTAVRFLAEAHASHLSPLAGPTLLPSTRAAWLLDLVPVRWFPPHAPHTAMSVVCRAAVVEDGGAVVVAPEAPEIRGAACGDARCRRLAAWADRHARMRWPATYEALARAHATGAGLTRRPDGRGTADEARALLPPDGVGHVEYPVVVLLLLFFASA